MMVMMMLNDTVSTAVAAPAAGAATAKLPSHNRAIGIELIHRGIAK